MGNLYDYVLRHDRVEFIGAPTFINLQRWPRLIEGKDAITLTVAPMGYGVRLTPREAIVLGNALLDLARNQYHWKHPPI
jgi:hypothetical protein